MFLAREDMVVNKIKSQIATILTLVMAAIFLFIVITINIGNITQEKTMLSNASDGAALLLASSLGSLGNALRTKMGLFENAMKKCDWDVKFLGELIAAVILTIAALAAAVPSGSASLWAVVGYWALIIGAAASLGVTSFGMYNSLVAEPGVFKQAELKFQSMTLEQRMKEKAIQFALIGAVSDPNKFCKDGKCGDPKEHGGCWDPTDLDMNGDFTNCITCFSKWYNDRLIALPRVGDIVTRLYMAIFGIGADGIHPPNPLIYVWEDPETWKAKTYTTDFLWWHHVNFVECGFWIDTINYGMVDPKREFIGPPLDPFQGSLKGLDIASDDRHDTRGVVYAHDIYFNEWVTGRNFLTLLADLITYGYGIGKDDDIYRPIYDAYKLSSEINDFQNDLSKIYGVSYDSRVEAFDQWFPLFYNGDPDPKKQDWYKRMQGWLDIIEGPNGWISTLTSRRDRINTDFDNCSAPGPYTCGACGSDHWCASHCVCNCDPCPPSEDGDAGPSPEGGNAALFHTGDVRAHFAWFSSDSGKVLLASNGGDCGSCPCGGECHCECDSSCNCGPEVGGGIFCPRGLSGTPCQGRPKFSDTLPRKNCCDSTYFVHYQLVEPTLNDCTGSGVGCHGDSQCCDSYHKSDSPPVPPPHSLNIITREHAIDYLTKFASDVHAIRDALEQAYKDKKIAENDPRFNEAFYAWTDKVAKKGIGEQPVRHIVYVKLDGFTSYTTVEIPFLHIWLNNVKDKEFRFPTVHSYKQWDFSLFDIVIDPGPPPHVVTNFDLTPPVSNCVTVESDKGTFTVTVERYDQDVGGVSSSPLKNLWTFKTRGQPSDTEPNFPLIVSKSPYDADPAAVAGNVYADAIKFVSDNGIVSKTEGHYGPGWTYQKDEYKNWNTEAAKRNKDIYIQRLR